MSNQFDIIERAITLPIALVNCVKPNINNKER